jgi:hypothetical protein
MRMAVLYPARLGSGQHQRRDGIPAKGLLDSTGKHCTHSIFLDVQFF